MKNALLFLSLLASVVGAAQKSYWQQQVDVTLQVQLNDVEHTLDGFEKIRYTNHSPDTLRYIWFHLWPNAYKNDRTAFSEQLLQLGNTDFYFSSKEQRGYINRLDFKVNGATANMEDHPEYIDVVKVLLPAPLPPGAQAVITTPFHVKLPYLFSRSGYKNGAFQVTQWFPKPAVYDAQGWHPMPYLEQGEFYSEFGDYDVTITLPENYVVAATGVLQNEDEIIAISASKNKATSRQQTHLTQHRPLKKFANPSKNKSDSNFFKRPYALKTLQYKEQNIHDFAWVANPGFRVDEDTCRLSSGKTIIVKTYYTDKPKTVWKKSLLFAKDAVRFYSAEVGDYPYSTLRIVESTGAPGGMEYPTLSIIGPADAERDLDVLMAHEVGHNWFYAALATNERAAPWLDEGINTFYDKKYTAHKYGPDAPWPALLFQTLAREKRDQPIATPAMFFSDVNYSLIAYDKTARWLDLIEQQLGVQRFQETMHAYFSQWQFKHPQEALKNAFAAALPDTSAFRFLYNTGLLPNQPLTKNRVLTPLLPGTIIKYIKQPSKHILFLSPAFGYNYYDKGMIGGLVTNYSLPPARVQFLAAPLYGTGSKKWNGIGIIRYNQYATTWFRKWEVGLSGMAFSKNYLLDSNGRAHFERFFKLAPYVRFTINEPVQSTRERWLEARTFFITEKNFSKFVTKTTDGLTYVDSLATTSRYVNQLTWNVTNYRALYPYSYRLQLQQGPAFYRMNAIGTYFFNYVKGGGAEARLFFGAFGYLTQNESQRLAATRYEPKLLGNSGEEDFTYHAYFIGRTASYANDASVVQNAGLAAQQIMLRDGAFKWRLDPFEFLQGRSQHWVAALNLNTTLPRQIVPAFIPLKLFLDVGTYAEALKQPANTSRILYVGGLQVSLAHNVLNIYAPLVYSAVFRDNLKALPEQNTFLKRLTFSVDFGQLSVQHFTSNKFSF